MGIFEELKEKIVKECEDRNIITDLKEYYEIGRASCRERV